MFRVRVDNIGNLDVQNVREGDVIKPTLRIYWEDGGKRLNKDPVVELAFNDLAHLRNFVGMVAIMTKALEKDVSADIKTISLGYCDSNTGDEELERKERVLFDEFARSVLELRREGR